MTRAFVRTKRDGTWQNIEIDQLTDAEIDELASKQPDRGWIWVKFLVQWIRENVKEIEESK